MHTNFLVDKLSDTFFLSTSFHGSLNKTVPFRTKFFCSWNLFFSISYVAQIVRRKLDFKLKIYIVRMKFTIEGTGMGWPTICLYT